MGDISKYTLIGIVTKEIANIKNFKYPGNVYVAPGLIKHIQKHKNEFSEDVLKDLFGTMKSVLNTPDYVGCDPKEEGTSLELIKKIDDNILIALQFDITDNYIYVASLYTVTDAKIHNRLYSKRLIKV